MFLDLSKKLNIQRQNNNIYLKSKKREKVAFFKAVFKVFSRTLGCTYICVFSLPIRRKKYNKKLVVFLYLTPFYPLPLPPNRSADSREN
jgi:hypothetical protein